MRSALLDYHRQSEGQQQAQNRVGAVKTAEQQPFNDDAETANNHWRSNERAKETYAIRQDHGEVCADSIEAAMGEINDSTKGEDQRETKRDQ